MHAVGLASPRLPIYGASVGFVGWLSYLRVDHLHVTLPRLDSFLHIDENRLARKPERRLPLQESTGKQYSQY